ncbi:MAG: hypothetical protein ACTSRP_09990, partial [Candidatus Helarchaeota archaeon]
MKKNKIFLSLFISILIVSIFIQYRNQVFSLKNINSYSIDDNFNTQIRISSFNITGNVYIYINKSIATEEIYRFMIYDLKKEFPNVFIKNDSAKLENNSIVIGSPAINKITQQIVSSGNLSLKFNDLNANSYHIVNLYYNKCNVIIIAGKDNLGDAYGVYWFIEYYLKLYPEKIDGINITRSTDVIYRRSGLTFTYQTKFSLDSPYIIDSYPNASLNNLKAQINFSLRYGINMFSMGSFLKCLNFDDLDPNNPYSIYSNNSEYRSRHLKYREYWNNLINYAKKFNFTIIISTDMFPYTPPIKEYLGGKFDINDPKLWKIINASIFEIFSVLNIDGIVVRIGEGGEVGSAQYTSAVIFRDIESTKMLIRNLLSYIDTYNSKYNTNKFLIFRTWTIGIGEIGDLHIDPDIFHKVFDEFNNRTNLILSIKHVAMDFYHYVPRNPTIGIGNLPIIIEFQSAREYEGYGNYPNYLAQSFQNDILYFNNFSNFKGVW